MADRGDTHYYVPSLNKWFAFSSLVLLVATLWLIVDDAKRPWKEYQRRFRELEVARAQQALQSPELLAAMEAEERLRSELGEAMVAQAGREAEIAKAQEALRQAKGQQFTATEDAKMKKQALSFQVFLIEEHRVEAGDPEYGTEQLADLRQELTDSEKEQESWDLEVERLEGELAGLRAVVTERERELKAATKELELVRKNLRRLAPEAVSEKLADIVRDFPGLDFIEPNLKVRKVVLANLTNDLNFTTKQRIDMCHTCHMAIDREGYEDEGQPFTSHPRLDLYLTAKSPHPIKDVGCTICHRGCGEALDFIRVDHRPTAEPGQDPMDSGQWPAWREEHHWHKQHHWDWPMLTREYTEASCVQCHKDSMELIAEDAPTVYEGYELFERYGCYSCHKVEWFPTKRRPGPSLANWQSKFELDWMTSWVTNPKDFRPTTWMPQVFHLENFVREGAEEVVVKSKWGEGREILGREWGDNAVASIVTFLELVAPEAALPEVPTEGDAERGREAFRLSGCLACHNLAPYPGTETQTTDPAFERREENEHGPNLRGVATKINARWLFSWIKNPHAYWDQTYMPDLRLSDQDAADITSYVMDDPDGIFTDVPEGWEPAEPTYDVEVLQEQARHFYKRLGRVELERRFAGESSEHRWDDTRNLLVAVGEKWIGNQGCFSCHEIPTMESMMPIGTELTNWGSKTVDKLDWGLWPEIMAEEHGWQFEEREEYKQYREHWIEQKLTRPRSYDLGKLKAPLDKLRMPWFDLTPEQVKALACFTVGLVDDEVQRAKMLPDSGQLARDHGLRSLRQKNCRACHVLEPGTVTFLRDGDEVTVTAELMPIGESIMPPRQDDRASLLEAIAEYEEEYEEEVEEIGFRLMEPHPGIGLPGENVFAAPEDVVAVTSSWGGGMVHLVTDYYVNGIEMYDPEAESAEDAYYPWNLGEEGEVEDVDGELRAYYEEPYDKVRWTFAPPVLVDEGSKVQRDWFYAFLMDPVTLRHQMRVRMPSFHFEPGEAEAIADYFAYEAERRWPASFTRKLRYALGIEPKASFASAGLPWPEIATQVEVGQGLSFEEMAERAEEQRASSGLRAETIRAIEHGSAPDTAASFDKVLALADAVGFRERGPVTPGSERIERRSPSHMAERAPFIDLGSRLATDPGAVNCYQCHWHENQPPEQLSTPIAWAPDLSMARERLREGWVHDWLWNPVFVYPGTAMPANFTGDPPQYQAFYPDSTNDEQVQAVMDWLFNFDRWASAARN